MMVLFVIRYLLMRLLLAPATPSATLLTLKTDRDAPIARLLRAIGGYFKQARNKPSIRPGFMQDYYRTAGWAFSTSFTK
jgi:hypothetical protein